MTNPLCGPNGASAIFGPQKGATPAIVVELDTALLAYSRLAAQFFGQDLSTLPGAGAAGGLGFAFAAFLHANLQPGAELVIEATGLEQALSQADLVVTGEGRFDHQSLGFGKLIAGVLDRAGRAKVPVVILAGSVLGDVSALYRHNASVMACVDRPMALETAMENAAPQLRAAAARAFAFVRM